MKKEHAHGLRTAIHSYSNADDRWERLKAQGASDEALEAAIVYEFGIQGGSSLPNHAWQEHKGGSNPQFVYRAEICGETELVLEGKELIKEVRQLMEIPFENGYVAPQQTSMF